MKQCTTRECVLRKLWLFTSAAVSLGFTLAVFNRPLIAAARHGVSINRMVKNYFLGDISTYMSIVSNVEHHGYAYAEPHTNSGTSIYPSAYYFLSGLLARVPGIDAIGAYNLAGVISVSALVAIIAMWIRHATRSALYWLLAPVPVFIGTLLWLSPPDRAPFWFRTYGDHAVIWPPAAILFGNGSEAPGLVFGFSAILVLNLALAHDGARAIRLTIASGALLGVAFNFHSYVSIFCIAWTLAFLVGHAAVALPSHQRWAGLALSTFAVVGAAIIPLNTSLAKLAIVAAALAAPIVLLPAYRKAQLKVALVLGISFLVTSAPLLARIVAQAADKGSYLYLRSEAATTKDLALPLRPLIWMNASVLVLIIATLLWLLSRKAKTPFQQRWLAMLASGTVVWIGLMFNRAWGPNQEPYRFLPYGVICLTAICLPWLLTVPRKTIFSIGLRALTAVALVLTLPVTRTFFRDNRGVLEFSPQEQRAYQEIGRFLGNKEIAFSDSCVSSQLVRIVSGTPTAHFQFGLAIPKRHGEMSIIVDRVVARTIPSTNEFQRAGVKWVITSTYCQGGTPDLFRQRYSLPTRVIPLENPKECGLPEDFAFEIFKVRANQDSPYQLPSDNGRPQLFREMPTTTPTRSCMVGTRL